MSFTCFLIPKLSATRDLLASKCGYTKFIVRPRWDCYFHLYWQEQSKSTTAEKHNGKPENWDSASTDGCLWQSSIYSQSGTKEVIMQVTKLSSVLLLISLNFRRMCLVENWGHLHCCSAALCPTFRLGKSVTKTDFVQLSLQFVLKYCLVR